MSKPERWDIHLGEDGYWPYRDGDWVRYEDIEDLELHPSGTAALMREMAGLLEETLLSHHRNQLAVRTEDTLARYKEMTDE